MRRRGAKSAHELRGLKKTSVKGACLQFIGGAIGERVILKLPKEQAKAGKRAFRIVEGVYLGPARHSIGTVLLTTGHVGHLQEARLADMRFQKGEYPFKIMREAYAAHRGKGPEHVVSYQKRMELAGCQKPEAEEFGDYLGAGPLLANIALLAGRH
jgi:hypothetical protein